MVNLNNLIGPGTAGVAQRIDCKKEKYENKLKYSKKAEADELEVLQYNKLMTCGHNQY